MKRREPRDEKLEYTAYTGCVSLPSDWVQALDEYSPPHVMPWEGDSVFYDWNEMCIPRYTLPTTVPIARRQLMSDIVFHRPLVPKYEDEPTPSWPATLQWMPFSADNNTIVIDPDPYVARYERDVERLQVNGSYYHIHMVLEGIIQVSVDEGTQIGTVGAFDTQDGGPPCVRLLAIQFPGDDITEYDGCEVPVGHIWRQTPTEERAALPWNMSMRWNRKDKEELETVNDAPYRILHDQTIVLSDVQRGMRNRLPFKLDFGQMVREIATSAAYKEEVTSALLPRVPAVSTPSTNAASCNTPGRIIWGLFHNLKHLSREEGQRQLYPQIFWSGRWTFVVTDGNF